MNSPLRITAVLASKIRMSLQLLSILGILAAILCLGVATRLHPGGYDWNRDMISTLLRDPYPTCIPAVAGIVLFCVSIALIFERLTHAVEFSKHSRVIRIAGIGSMVYAS
ncbi:MAG: hypothetical protein NT023_04335, partial [Armatimonadetes bacterium]|nr:hypothetical protein [Armatimonadota bacterium]